MYELSTDPSRLDIVAIHAFLAATYWSKGIPRATLKRAIANSLCAVVWRDGQQVGFARAITDKATFAYLADVYVLEAHRGRGLARRLVGTLQPHPELQGLRRILLATRNAHGLYAGLGFRPLAAPERMMEIQVPNVYGAP